MLKMAFSRPVNYFICFLCLITPGAIGVPAAAQDTAAAPSDPKALMLEAAKTNGLSGSDIKPWHLKAAYRLLDEKGNVSDQGIYEEFWVSPAKYKRTFTGATFTQTEYGTEKGILFAGNQESQFTMAEEVRNEFFAPLPDPLSIERNSYNLQQSKIGNLTYNCLRIKDLSGTPFGPTWCLDTARPALRISAHTAQSQQNVHNRIITFQGHFIAGEMQFFRSGKLFLTTHIDSIEPITTIDEAALIPSPDATPLQRKVKTVNVSTDVTTGMLIKMVQPEYPPFAKEHGTTGTIVLQATIGKDGHITDLHVVSGPLVFQQAALNAVKDWLYRPYLLNGEPVQVRTTINVNFGFFGHQ